MDVVSLFSLIFFTFIFFLNFFFAREASENFFETHGRFVDYSENVRFYRVVCADFKPSATRERSPDLLR